MLVEKFDKLLMVNCFEFSDPLRQCFSLYQPSPREKEDERNDRREEKMSKQLHPYPLQAQ